MARTTTGRSIVAVAAMAAALTTAVSGSARATSTVDVSAIAETSPPRTFADVDGDRVSDEFEADLLGAEPTALVDVIIRTSADVTYPGATPLPSIGGFAATMRVSDVLGFAADPRTVRVDRDGVVALTDDGGRADHGVDRAEVEFGATGAGVGICVIDSGVDPNHEQLDNGKVAAFTDFINPPGAPLGPYDDHSPSGGGHGTHVASIAAGDGVGGPLAAQYRGVAPDATLYVAKAFEGTIPDDIPVISPATTQESITIQAIEWCVNDTPADIVSMSFTKTGPSDGTDPLGAAVAAAIDAGVVAVAAAGNDGPNPGLVGSPGALERVITVGAVADWSLPLTAVNRSEGPYLPAFSSRGPTADGRTKPDVVAPGHSVLAARSNTVALYADKSGTSMATPFVAGAVALVLEQHPTLGHDDVKALIEQTAIDRGPAGKDGDWGSGMLDVYGLLAAADGATSYEPTPFPTNSVLTGSTAATGSWTHDFVLTAADLDIPIAATMLIDGGPDVSGAFWDPDLQLTLTDPNGVQLDFSNCPLLPDANDCLGNTAKAGRQELVHALPTVAGTYRLDVSGPSGSFLIDLTHGPVAAATPTGVCTVTWTGAGDGTTWSMPTNWSSLTGPLPTDVACIPAGAAVSLAGPATVRAVVVEGALTVQAPGMLLLTDPAVPSEITGELVIDAGATVDTAVALDVRGRLSGSGQVDGSVNNRGDVRPGDSVPGDLTITADYTQYAGGTLTVDVGTAADRLVVGGTTALDGTLVVVTGVVPTPGDDVEILDAVVRTGTFATLDGADAGPSVHWEIDAVSDAPDVHLVAVAGPPVDGDGRVTICHKPGTNAEKTKQVPPSAVHGHVGHGDTHGAC